MTKKTVTELIFDYLDTFGIKLHEDTKHNFPEIEKQQIIEAAKHGADCDNSPFISAEDYFNKTYLNNETN